MTSVRNLICVVLCGCFSLGGNFVQAQITSKLKNAKIIKTSECDQSTQTFTQEIVITYNQVDISPQDQIIIRKADWQQAYPITQSPQTIKLIGLDCELASQNVEAYLGSNPSEILNVENIIEISAINIRNCNSDDNTFYVDVSIEYIDIVGDQFIVTQILDGTEVLAQDSADFERRTNFVQSFQLTANGKNLEVNTAVYSTRRDIVRLELAVSDTFTAAPPCLDCRILGVSKPKGIQCQEDGTFNQEVQVKYSYYPDEGTNSDVLIVTRELDTLLKQEVTPQSDMDSIDITLTNLVADGLPYNLSFFFQSKPDCRMDINPLFTAPDICYSIEAFRLVDNKGNIFAEYISNPDEIVEIPLEELALPLNSKGEPKIAFEVTTIPQAVGSLWLRLSLEDELKENNVEKVAPYALFGNVGQNFTTRRFKRNLEYKIEATPFKNSSLAGPMGITNELRFKFVDSPAVNPEEFNQAFSIYPNPSNNGKVSLAYEDAKSPYEPGVFYIYDDQGNQVFTQRFSGNFQEQINLKDFGLGKGLYLVKLVTNQGSFTKRFQID